MPTTLTPEDILRAAHRIDGHVHRTPLMSSSRLNRWLGHEITFKMEPFQKVGAFKYRGVTNTILSLKEQNRLPQEVIAFSSGNHAQATAKVCATFGIPATVYMAENTSPVKQAATRSYSAAVKLFPSRRDAEEAAAHDTMSEGRYLLHPYDNDTVIAGQGTACLEALQDGQKPDAIFATCSGGGWISGTYLAAQAIHPNVPVYAGEPLQANDAARSYRAGIIQQYDTTPNTIADGATALSVKSRTFQYLQQLAGFYEIAEQDILYWTQWLTSLLKVSIEPTSAVAMAAAAGWLSEQSEKSHALVMLSGGNIAPETHQKIWQENYLEIIPTLNKENL